MGCAHEGAGAMLSPSRTMLISITQVTVLPSTETFVEFADANAIKVSAGSLVHHIRSVSRSTQDSAGNNSEPCAFPQACPSI